MARAQILILTAALALGACGPDIAELEAPLAAEPRGADAWPDLVPLGPLLDRVDAAPPREAAPEGETLEERGEDLRARAARLRALPL
ncbi:MAG: hypothetical protein ACOCY0_02590 [Roseicyclus sp.]